MKTYALSLTGKLIVLGSIGVLLLYCLLVVTLPLYEDVSDVLFTYMIPACAILGVLLAIVFADAATLRLTVTPQSIRRESVVIKRELFFNEIKGFVVKPNQYETKIVLVPLDKKKKKIRISSFMEGYGELDVWVARNFADLHRLAREEAMKNPRLGNSTDETDARMTQARIAVQMLNGCGVICILAAILLQDHWQYSIPVLMALPWIGGLIALYHKGFVRLEMSAKSPFPSLFIACFMSAAVLFLLAMVRVNVLDHAGVWMPAAVLAASLAVFLCWSTKRLHAGVVALALVLSAIYGYGTIIFANSLEDTSEPVQYTATVLGKRSTTEKFVTTCYLEISAWGPQDRTKEETVPESLYQRAGEGVEVNITLRPGRLRIPWYTVSLP